MKISVDELSSILKLSFQGNGSTLIDSVGTLENAVEGQLSFLSSPAYKKHMASSAASAIIVSESDARDCAAVAIFSHNPYLDYARAVKIIYSADEDTIQQTEIQTFIHPTAVVGQDCQLGSAVSISANVVIGDHVSLGDRVAIGPGCVIEQGAQLGNDTVLEANVTVLHSVELGMRCLIHAGVVLGCDGFGFANDTGKWVKIPQVGSVIVGNDVDIGANTTVDRGAIDNTVIEDGVILDNLIQVGHNVRIGKHTAIAAHTAIAGSTSIGAYCMIAGCVAIAGHLKITDHVTINGVSMVSRSIPKQGDYSGIPAQETHAWRRNIVRLRNIDKLFERVKKLETKKQK